MKGKKMNTVMFISARMQPPTKGHIMLIREAIKYGDNDNFVIITLGLSPVDQKDQIKEIYNKLKNNNIKVNIDELREIVKNININGKVLWDKISSLVNGNEKLINSIKTRILNYRKVYIKDLSKSILNNIKNNPFPIHIREEMIRSQLSESENKRILILPITGVNNSTTILSKEIYHYKSIIDFMRVEHNFVDFRKIFITAGDEYLDRATIIIENGNTTLTNNRSFCELNGYDDVVCVARDNKDKISGSIVRDIINDIKLGKKQIKDLVPFFDGKENTTSFIKKLVNISEENDNFINQNSKYGSKMKV
jgi:nicotinamide mononucleotide adenylyltransferase